MAIVSGGTWPEKDQQEIITVTFEFTSLVEPISVVAVTATTIAGQPDASPGDILTGPASVVGKLVMQRVRAGVDGAKYSLRAVASDAVGNIAVVVAGLPVRNAIVNDR